MASPRVFYLSLCVGTFWPRQVTSFFTTNGRGYSAVVLPHNSAPVALPENDLKYKLVIGQTTCYNFYYTPETVIFMD